MFRTERKKSSTKRKIERSKKGRKKDEFVHLIIYIYILSNVLDEGKKKFDGKRKRPNEDSIDSIKRSSYPFNKYNRCPKTS